MTGRITTLGGRRDRWVRLTSWYPIVRVLVQLIGAGALLAGREGLASIACGAAMALEIARDRRTGCGACYRFRHRDVTMSREQ